jgi:hypothetical protein
VLSTNSTKNALPFTKNPMSNIGNDEGNKEGKYERNDIA